MDVSLLGYEWFNAGDAFITVGIAGKAIQAVQDEAQNMIRSQKKFLKNSIFKRNLSFRINANKRRYYLV